MVGLVELPGSGKEPLALGGFSSHGAEASDLELLRSRQPRSSLLHATLPGEGDFLQWDRVRTAILKDVRV